MGILEGLFPDIMGAQHLRDISENMYRQQMVSQGDKPDSRMVDKINQLISDRDSLALILFSLIQNLADKDIISKDDLLKVIKELDILDGKEDGRLNINYLRGSLGVKVPEKPAAKRTKKTTKSKVAKAKTK